MPNLSPDIGLSKGCSLPDLCMHGICVLFKRRVHREITHHLLRKYLRIVKTYFPCFDDSAMNNDEIVTSRSCVDDHIWRNTAYPWLWPGQYQSVGYHG